jgi:hypothetical protein
MGSNRFTTLRSGGRRGIIGGHHRSRIRFEWDWDFKKSRILERLRREEMEREVRDLRFKLRA